MEDDWDLHAVVRGRSASASAAAASSATTSCSQFFKPINQNCNFPAGGLQDLFEPSSGNFIEQLQGLHKPFFPTLHSSQTVFSPQSFPISPLSVLGGLQDLLTEQQQSSVNQLPLQKHQSFSVANVSKPKSEASHHPSSKLKRRKNHVKRVCHVPVESLSSDMWSWRKYGQKSIKGSPYPRGYYRCSTLKGCMARKQVERNRSDPGMFIVTHTGEHNHPMPTHRNSLAGGRQNQKANPKSDEPTKPICSPVMSPEDTLSPVPEKVDCSQEDLVELEAEDEEHDFRVSNVALDDDFFSGLEDLICPNMGECSSDRVPGTLQFPWLANYATTTAGGGG